MTSERVGGQDVMEDWDLPGTLGRDKSVGKEQGSDSKCKSGDL